MHAIAPEVYQKIFTHRQVVKFLFAGGIGASVDLSVYSFLTYVAGLWYVTSSIVSFCVAFGASFVLQKFWTFRDRSTYRVMKQSALYFGVAVVNLSVNTLLVFLFVDYAGVHKFLSKVLASGIVAIESFLVYRYIIFAGSSTGIREFQKNETTRR